MAAGVPTFTLLTESPTAAIIPTACKVNHKQDNMISWENQHNWIQQLHQKFIMDLKASIKGKKRATVITVREITTWAEINLSINPQHIIVKYADIDMYKYKIPRERELYI